MAILKVLVVGAGGHARVIIDTLRMRPDLFLPAAVTDPDRTKHGQSLLGVPIVGDDNAWPDLKASGIDAAFAAIGDNGHRSALFDRLSAHGFTLVNAVHPAAVVSSDATLGRGVALMAGAIVNAGAVIGDNVIINTAASVDHDCQIERDVHVAPGSHLGGCVIVGAGAFIGLGASVVPSVRIGARAIVGAGAVVIGAVADGDTVVGVPARALKGSR